MKAGYAVVLFAVGLVCVLLGQPLTIPLGSPRPALLDVFANPVRIGYGLDVTNRTLYVTNSGGGGGLSSPVNATNISSGTVTDTEFDFLNGVTSAIQAQLDSKQPTLSSNVAAGTYRSVTVETNGLVTAGTNPTTFGGYAISDTSANLAAALTDETGTGNAVFSANPTLSGVVTNSGVFRLSGGSAANPSYGFSTGTNSGLWYDGAVRIVVAGTTRLSLLSSFSQFAGRLELGSGVVSIDGESSGVTQFGVDAATATAQTVKSHDGVGTDKASADLTLAAGQSTGLGVRGNLKGKVASIGTTGSSANAYTTSFGIGGRLKVDTTTATNALTGEDDLIAYSVSAGQLSVNGDSIEWRVAGSFAGTINAKRLRVYFGSTVLIDTTALVLNGIDWGAHGVIIRTGSATQIATSELTIGGTLLGATTTTITDTASPTETLSGAVLFKATGEGVADADIVQNLMVLNWQPNN